jgi:hypothetical protein
MFEGVRDYKKFGNHWYRRLAGGLWTPVPKGVWKKETTCTWAWEQFSSPLMGRMYSWHGIAPPQLTIKHLTHNKETGFTWEWLQLLYHSCFHRQLSTSGNNGWLADCSLACRGRTSNQLLFWSSSFIYSHRESHFNEYWWHFTFWCCAHTVRPKKHLSSEQKGARLFGVNPHWGWQCHNRHASLVTNRFTFSFSSSWWKGTRTNVLSDWSK